MTLYPNSIAFQEEKEEVELRKQTNPLVPARNLWVFLTLFVSFS